MRLRRDQRARVEELADRADGARRSDVHGRKQRNDRRPCAQNRSRLKREVDDRQDDQADDPRARRGGKDRDHVETGDQPPFPARTAGEIQHQGQQDHQEHAERDRVLGRRQHAEPTAAELFAATLELKERKERLQVVEDVVSGAPLDDPEEGDDRTADASSLTKNCTSNRVFTRLMTRK